MVENGRRVVGRAVVDHEDVVGVLPHMTLSMFEEFCSESVLSALKDNTQRMEVDVPHISVHEIIRLRIAESLSNASSPRSNNDDDNPDEDYMVSLQELEEHRKQSNGAESSPSASNGTAVSESPLVTFLPRPSKPTVPICVYQKHPGLKLFDELRAPNPHQLTEPEISHAFYDLQDEARRYRGKTPVPMPKDGEKQHFEFICYDPLGTNEPAERERATIFTAALNKYDPKHTVSRSLAFLAPPCPGQMRGDGFNCGYVLLETAQNILQGLFAEKISQKLRSINQPIPLHVQHPVISYMDGTIPAVYFLQPGKINLFSENNFIEEVVAKLFMIKERALVFIPLLVNDGHWVLQLISNSPLRLYEKGQDIKQISPLLFNPHGLVLQIRHPDYQQKMQLVRANWEAYFSSLAEKKVLYVHALGAYDLSLVDDKPVKPSGNIYLGIQAESSELFYVVYQNNIEVGRGDLPEVRQQFAVTTDNLPSLLKHKVFKNTIVAAAAKNKHAVVSPVVQIDDNYSFAHARDEQIKQDRTEQVAYRLCALMRKSAEFTVWIAQILTNYPLEHYNNLSEDLRLFTPYITDVLCSAFEDENPTIMQQLIRTNLHQYISDELTKHFKEHFVNLLSVRFAQRYPYLPEDNDVSTMWACVMTEENNVALMQLVTQLNVQAEIVKSLGTLLRPRYKPIANTTSFAGFMNARPQVGKRPTTERLEPVAIVSGGVRSQEEPIKVVPEFTAAAKVAYWLEALTTLHEELYRLYQDNQKNGAFLASVCNELLTYTQPFKDIRPTAHEQLNYRKVIQWLNEIRNQNFNVGWLNRAGGTIVNKKNELIMKTLALLLLVPDVVQEEDVRKYLMPDSRLKNGNSSGKIPGPIYIADQVEKKLKDFQITSEERQSLFRKP